jgi:cytochrome c553
LTRLTTGLVVLLAPMAAYAEPESLQDKIDDGRNATSHLCLSCHAVKDTGTAADAPSFATIAATCDDSYLRQFLKRGHPEGTVPAVAVSPYTDDDIVVYIESLKK